VGTGVDSRPEARFNVGAGAFDWLEEAVEETNADGFTIHSLRETTNHWLTTLTTNIPTDDGALKR
jgi:hypothetical protein